MTIWYVFVFFFFSFYNFYHRFLLEHSQMLLKYSVTQNLLIGLLDRSSDLPGNITDLATSELHRGFTEGWACMVLHSLPATHQKIKKKGPIHNPSIHISIYKYVTYLCNIYISNSLWEKYQVRAHHYFQ